MDRSKQPPQQVKLTPQEVDALKARIEKCKLPPSDIKLMLGLLSFNQWLQERLSRAKLTIKRLRQLFGFTNEKIKKRKPAEPDAPADVEQASAESTNEDGDRSLLSDSVKPDAADVEKPPGTAPVTDAQWDSNKNHGRRGADEYTGCALHKVGFEDEYLKSGYCPDCAISCYDPR